MPFDVFSHTSQFTCCSRLHGCDRNGDPKPCDRHALMLPMLGLYAKMLARREEPRFAALLPQVEGHIDDIFPRQIIVTREGGDATEQLFGNLVQRIARHVLEGGDACQ